MSQPSIELLLEDCQSGDPSKQTPAIMKLRDLEAFEAIPVLINLLTASEENVRGCAVEALGLIGSREIETVGSALIISLEDPEALIRSDALEALSRLRYIPAMELTTILLRSDPDWVVRATAAEILADLAETGNPEVLVALDLALDDPIDSVRSYAACSIGLLGEASPELLSNLQIYLSSEESLSTKAEILAARYRLGADDDLNKLLELLNDADEHLAGIILNILEDLAERKTPKTFVAKFPKLKEAIIKISTLFPIQKNRADQVVAQLEGVAIQSQLLGLGNAAQS